MRKKLFSPAKGVSNIELFYDLIFVYCISVITGVLHHPKGGFFDLETYALYAVDMLTVLQVWFFTTFLQNRYGDGGAFDNVCLFINMFLLFFMAGCVGHGWQGSMITWNLVWAFVLVDLLVHWGIKRIRYTNLDDADRRIMGRTMIVLGVQATIAFVAAFLPWEVGQWVSLVTFAFGWLTFAQGGRLARKARLPEDAFCHRNPTMTAEGYYAFMEAVGRLCPDGATALALATGEVIEQFSPPVFAAFCSPDGRTCVERLARHKRLVGPLMLMESEDAKMLKVELADERGLEIPQFLAECELAFLVNLMRRATKEDVVPLSAMLTERPHPKIAAFLGCEVARGPVASVTFSSADMVLPFISRNDAMWGYFEPELARRLSELDADGTFSARVRSALIEMLPAGASDALVGRTVCCRRHGCSCLPCTARR